MTTETDVIKLADKPDRNCKETVWEITPYLAFDTVQLLQLWQSPTTGEQQWRPVPDLEEFCDEHGISPECR